MKSRVFALGVTGPGLFNHAHSASLTSLSFRAEHMSVLCPTFRHFSFQRPSAAQLSQMQELVQVAPRILGTRPRERGTISCIWDTQR